MLQPRASTAPGGNPMTRNESVQLEGRTAAEKNMNRHDNPYRSGSADGIAWHQGFDDVAAPNWRRAV
ncbi:hypothetical protein M673_22445 (plasmid) [Aureimonas sp. AU20]|nr:hypothetical protein M673_22445 [Aureimonas sp. AU20]